MHLALHHHQVSSLFNLSHIFFVLNMFILLYFLHKWELDRSNSKIDSDKVFTSLLLSRSEHVMIYLGGYNVQFVTDGNKDINMLANCIY